jgi:hypothetical protein
MIEVLLQSYENLSEEEKMVVSDIGFGREGAAYIRVVHGGKTISLNSDAMEPDDCTFHADLNWIVGLLQKCYELGVQDGISERVRW